MVPERASDKTLTLLQPRRNAIILSLPVMKLLTDVVVFCLQTSNLYINKVCKRGPDKQFSQSTYARGISLHMDWNALLTFLMTLSIDYRFSLQEPFVNKKKQSLPHTFPVYISTTVIIQTH